MPKSRAGPSSLCLGVDEDGKPCPKRASDKLVIDGRKYYFHGPVCRTPWLALQPPHFAVAAAPQIAASKAKHAANVLMHYHKNP